MESPPYRLANDKLRESVPKKDPRADDLARPDAVRAVDRAVVLVAEAARRLPASSRQRCGPADRLKNAREQAVRERENARRSRTAIREITSRPRRARSAYAAWLDERDAAMPLTRADLHSQLDDMAAGVVAAGGGMQAVLDATDLRTLENVVGSIDPAILKQAFDNDALAQLQPPLRS